MSIVYWALLSVSYTAPYDNTIMTQNGYGIIEGTVKIIMEGLRKSLQIFVRAADKQTSRINSQIVE